MKLVVSVRRVSLLQNDIISRSLHPPRFPFPPTPLRVRHQHTATSTHSESRLPRVFQPSIWHSIIPRSLRARPKPTSTASKPSNPANYFIWIYLLIGSQAIRILGLKNEHQSYMRRAEGKIAKLRDVIERLQRGEQVDVARELGSGVAKEEEEWEEALREVLEEERKWGEGMRKEREMREKEEGRRGDASPVNVEEGGGEAGVGFEGQEKTVRAPGFY